MNNNFSEALALAKLISDSTGVSIEEALKSLSELSSHENGLAPFSREKFIKAADKFPHGAAEVTVRDLCNQAGIAMPYGSKSGAYLLKSLGWERSSTKQNGLNLWRKP
jgi:hypothetical protein